MEKPSLWYLLFRVLLVGLFNRGDGGAYTGHRFLFADNFTNLEDVGAKTATDKTEP
jgi:hypothetical protein